MKRAITALTITLVASCSSGSTGNEPTGAVPDTPLTSPTPTPVFHAPKTASKVVRHLHKLNPHVHLTVVYTARSDPNDLLGRPGSYVSKSAFSDDRVRASDIAYTEKGAVERGGSVEYFATHNAAITRAHYLQSLSGNGAFGTSEYDYVDGGVLLRVTFNVLPRDAKQYRRALAMIMGQPAVAVTSSE